MTHDDWIGGPAIGGDRIMQWARPVGGVAILCVIAWRVGVGPFIDGIRLTTVPALAAAASITALTTLCCAWRWSLVAGGLGVDVPLKQAVGAYYRSGFLNATLPGGVLGDVHRGVRHGQAVGDQSKALRSVAWERASGQTVQIVLTLVVLLLVWQAPQLAIAGLAAVALLWLLGAHLPGRFGRLVATDLRTAVLTRRAAPGIALTSTLALMGYVVVFIIALHATGAVVPAGRLLPLALVILLAAAIPMNIAGWGPREGAAAWAFGAVGLTASEGVTVAVVYGVLSLVAVLPGAVLLVADWRRGLLPTGEVAHA